MVLLLSILTYLAGLLLIIFVVMQRKEPTATLAWILIIVTLPLLGVFLFLWFGLARVERKVTKKRKSNRAIAEQLQKIEETLAEHHVVPQTTFIAPVQKGLAQVTEGLEAFSITKDNSCRFLTEPEEVFSILEQLIDHAQDSIHMEYYIFRRDSFGKRIRDLLVKAARRGVEVRLLVDGVGSWTLGSLFARPLLEAGGKFAHYLPVTFLGRPWHWNLRNHRKITVIDGTVGTIGSPNIGNEYRHRQGRTTDFYDHLVLCEGPIVQQLQEVFASDWFFVTKENLIQDRYFPLLPRSGRTSAQIVAGGPDARRFTLHEMICAAIHAAEKTVRLVTPYFIPDQALIVALHSAALRGAKVQLMIARHHPSAHKYLMLSAARSYYDDLLSYGIEIHEYLPGVIHEKSIMVDSAWATAGTANIDIRSFRLNFEVNINFYSPEIVRSLEESFVKNLARCEQIHLDVFQKRPLSEQCLENTMRVFSPIL